MSRSDEGIDVALNFDGPTEVLVVADVLDEMRRSDYRVEKYAEGSMLRKSALVSEEAGEALTAALDLDRPDVAYPDVCRQNLYAETVQCAAMAIRLLAFMKSEDAVKDALRKVGLDAQ